ncbi:DUF3795 domain-containing protein [Maridesulfovibrio sp.]|uniref:DUF3795 domain-containing protein n=1 Tax=Maridesulfovibrio sp. TaxID=2795000 RepID=UPI002A18C9BA|nr:DUF3795 domain-containing protein [Maridesulfovibrio sp.]
MHTPQPFPRHLLSPCGLDCSRCVGCAEGTVSNHAKKIAEILGPNFEVYAQRLESFNPAMSHYAEFRALLESLAAPKCGGCRSETRICLPQCKVEQCVREHEIEFCFQCREFPDCGKTGLPENLLGRWQRNNQLMQKHGVDEFIRFQADKPRYP